ncbi:MAG: hypothetical protein PHP95_10145 [Desulfuromonadaceae bacterium]|nr:hypothetical protein [Desulfuromonadaceae bacterium]MDD2848804.1 hypothetical protein [Desulfuromonadaceae bacterium]MDD4130454.1 hypothetical protein [Desulfuromonadaceae bacterium]
MNLPKIMLYALSGTLVGIAIPVIAYMTIHFSPALSAQEKEVYNFVSTPLSIHTRGWKPVHRTCPVSPDTGMSNTLHITDTGMGLIDTKKEASDRLPRLSFILHGDKTRMAVIDGYVLKEGNSFDGWRVLRIEQKRTLLESKKDKKWISID